jgi:hypothetical protein
VRAYSIVERKGADGCRTCSDEYDRGCIMFACCEHDASDSYRRRYNHHRSVKSTFARYTTDFRNAALLALIVSFCGYKVIHLYEKYAGFPVFMRVYLHSCRSVLISL